MSKNKVIDFINQTYITRSNGYVDVFHKRELWKEVAQQLNGEFFISHNSGMEIETLRMTLVLNKRIVTLTESGTKPLKAEIEFRTVEHFSFNAGVPDFIDKLRIRLGMKHLDTANREFNEKFIVKTNNAIKAEQIFTVDIAHSIIEAKVGNMSFSTNERKHKSRLITTFSRSVKTESDFEKIISLLQAIISKLNSINITTD